MDAPFISLKLLGHHTQNNSSINHLVALLCFTNQINKTMWIVKLPSCPSLLYWPNYKKPIKWWNYPASLLVLLTKSDKRPKIHGKNLKNCNNNVKVDSDNPRVSSFASLISSLAKLLSIQFVFSLLMLLSLTHPGLVPFSFWVCYSWYDYDQTNSCTFHLILTSIHIMHQLKNSFGVYPAFMILSLLHLSYFELHILWVLCD